MNSSRRNFLGNTALIAAALSSARGFSVENKKNFSMSAQTKNLLSSLGLTYPILQAPIGSTCSPELTSAVSEAGGLGSIALTFSAMDDAKDKVIKIKSQTEKPFAVNYILNFEPKTLDSILDMGVPIIQFSWGIPNKKVVSAVRNAGAKFGVQISSMLGARAAIDAGASYLVCQGLEAGGHVQSSQMLSDLLQGVLQVASHSTPVFAAGGITTGKDIKNVLSLGAGGACLGTRFVATIESNAHPEHKQAILHAGVRDTVLSVCFSDGWPGATHRNLRNNTFNLWEAAGCPQAGSRPGENDILGRKPDGSPYLRYSAFSPSKMVSGDFIKECAFYAGLGVGKIKDIPKAVELVRNLWIESEMHINHIS